MAVLEKEGTEEECNVKMWKFENACAERSRSMKMEEIKLVN